MAFGADKDKNTRGLGQTLDRVSTGSNINQIRGVSVAGSTGSGIPKQVTDVAASVSNATAGATSVLKVTFRRDPSDVNFQTAQVYLRGYNGNNANVLVASGGDSPITTVINNTGESVVVTVQAAGNSGSAPISSAPTTGIKLPTGSAGGYGTGTTTSLPTQLIGDVTTSGTSSPLEATVVGLETVPLSNDAPNTTDTLRYNQYGDSKWDVVLGAPRFIQVYADGSNNPICFGHGNQPVTTGNRTLFATTATEMGADTYTSAATASLNVTAEVRQGFGGSNQGIYTFGTFYRLGMRIMFSNTTNVRYWFGLHGSASGGGTQFASDTPNFKYASFRYSAGTDSTIKACCGTSSGSQTVVNTGVSLPTAASKFFEILNTGSAFVFKIDGTTVATISTTIPSASDAYGVAFTADNKNTATAVGATLFYWTQMTK